MLAANPPIPVNPRMPATIATTKKISAQRNMELLLSWEARLDCRRPETAAYRGVIWLTSPMRSALVHVANHVPCEAMRFPTNRGRILFGAASRDRIPSTSRPVTSSGILFVGACSCPSVMRAVIPNAARCFACRTAWRASWPNARLVVRWEPSQPVLYPNRLALNRSP